MAKQLADCKVRTATLICHVIKKLDEDNKHVYASLIRKKTNYTYTTIIDFINMLVKNKVLTKKAHGVINLLKITDKEFINSLAYIHQTIKKNEDNK